jgi:restriction endonuclease Mrr
MVFRGERKMNESMIEVALESTQKLYRVQSMDETSVKNNLISHTSNPSELSQQIEAISDRILTEKSNELAQKKLALLEQLSAFEFGQFLIQNSCINGYWTHYMLTHPWNRLNHCKNDVEAFLLEKSPSILATQERFSIFLEENQSVVANN